MQRQRQREGGTVTGGRWACCIPVVLSLVGCSQTPPGPDAGPACPAGYQALQTACVPLLDDCTGDQVPVLGGGCKRVGVEECSDATTGARWGLRLPGAASCTPIGPPASCRAGWQKVTGGWCEPLLPASACPAGTMELLGSTTCQPLGDCGSGTWGKLSSTSGTLFVDGSYSGGSSDGSQSRPFATIGAALARVTGDGHVAVAAGTYNEDLTLRTDRVTLEGRCAQMVTVKGQAAAEAVLVLNGGTTVRGLSVTGPGRGISIWVAAGKSVIDSVAVHNTGNVGVLLNASATVRDTLVEAAKGGGVWVQKAAVGTQVVQAVLQRVVVRDIKRDPSGTYNFGTGVWQYSGSELTIKDSLVSAVTGIGVFAVGAKLVLEGSVIRRGAGAPGYTATTGGVWVENSSAGVAGTGTVRGCLIQDNAGVGVVGMGSKVQVQDTVISGTGRLASGGIYNVGAMAQRSYSVQKPAELTLRGGLVTGTVGVGVQVNSAAATIEGCVIRDNRPLTGLWQGSDYGEGIHVGDPAYTHGATLTLRDSLVAGNSSTGVAIANSRATLERVVVRDTKQGTGSGYKIGFGVLVRTGKALPRPWFKLTDSLIHHNAGIGLTLGDGDGIVQRTVLRQQKTVSQVQPGAGLFVRDSADGQQRPRLQVIDSVMASNQDVGILADSSSLTVSGSVVRDTGTGTPVDEATSGIQVTGGSLDISNSYLTRNHGVGLRTARGASGALRGVVVSHHRKTTQGYGDGLTASTQASMSVSDSLVEGNARVGLIYNGASGKLSRSVVRGCQLSVVYAAGVGTTITDDNVFLDNTAENRPTQMSLALPQPSKVPPLPPPP